MAVTFELPANIEQSLRRTFADLNQVAKESALVELFRQDKLTHHELSEALSLSRLETDAVLKKHNVTEDLFSNDEYAAALSHLRSTTDR